MDLQLALHIRATAIFVKYKTHTLCLTFTSAVDSNKIIHRSIILYTSKSVYNSYKKYVMLKERNNERMDLKLYFAA